VAPPRSGATDSFIGGRVATVRIVKARNASAMTLDGTRTYVVGKAHVAIIDPGPADQKHLIAVYKHVGAAPVSAILLTHTHPDHAAGAELFAHNFDAPVLAFDYDNLSDRDVIKTDAGNLVALQTPGHTRDSFTFWFETERAMFVGDMMMGGMDTALVAHPEGDLQRYINSLNRIGDYDPEVLYPAHGVPFDDPRVAIERYILHRQERIEQVLRAIESGATTADAIIEKVYGPELDAALREYVTGAIGAYVEYLRVTRRLPESFAETP
jgi:glyoxylase-like metal-dependent hydrolase (beta-lactamase superfamily II)